MSEFENALRSISRALENKDDTIASLKDALIDTTNELLNVRKRLEVVEQALARATKEDVAV
jgi:predicted  nucleic acid-binding Zn-ribbon protein